MMHLIWDGNWVSCEDSVRLRLQLLVGTEVMLRIWRVLGGIGDLSSLLWITQLSGTTDRLDVSDSRLRLLFGRGLAMAL